MKVYLTKRAAAPPVKLPAATLIALALHKRLELGSRLSPEQQGWLQSSPERWGLWLEFKTAADEQGVVHDPAALFIASSSAKPTRDYFYRGLVERGLVERLERGVYRVIV